MNRYGYSSVGRFDVFFCNQLLVFQQHQDESLYDSWTHFKDIIRKVQNHGLSIWTLIEIFLKHLDLLSRHIINLIAEGDLRKYSDIGAWYAIEDYAQYDKKCSNPTSVEIHRGIAWDTVENSYPQSTPQVLLSFEEYTSPVTFLKEVEETLGTPIEVEPLDKTQLEDLGLNTYISLGDKRGLELPIKLHSPDNFRMKEVDHLTNHTPPSPHVASFHPKDTYCYYHPCIGDPKKHYGFKSGLLGKSVSLGVDISNWEMFDDDWGLESKEVSPLGEELSLFDRPNEVERVRILEAHRLEPILQQQISQRMAPSHHDGMYRYYHPHLNSSVGEPSPLSVK
ncbi:hypothetical protein Tco_0031439 [Tanacetum coccineum]